MPITAFPPPRVWPLYSPTSLWHLFLPWWQWFGVSEDQITQILRPAPFRPQTSRAVERVEREVRPWPGQATHGPWNSPEHVAQSPTPSAEALCGSHPGPPLCQAIPHPALFSMALRSSPFPALPPTLPLDLLFSRLPVPMGKGLFLTLQMPNPIKDKKRTHNWDGVQVLHHPCEWPQPFPGGESAPASTCSLTSAQLGSPSPP